MKSEQSRQQSDKTEVRERISDVFHLPKDIVLGRPLISAIGRNEIYIENFLCIMIYDNCKLKLKTKTGYLLFEGRNIEVEYYDKYEIKICGFVDYIKFE